MTTETIEAAAGILTPAQKSLILRLHAGEIIIKHVRFRATNIGYSARTAITQSVNGRGTLHRSVSAVTFHKLVNAGLIRKRLTVDATTGVTDRRSIQMEYWELTEAGKAVTA